MNLISSQTTRRTVYQIEIDDTELAILRTAMNYYQGGWGALAIQTKACTSSPAGPADIAALYDSLLDLANNYTQK